MILLHNYNKPDKSLLLDEWLHKIDLIDEYVNGLDELVRENLPCFLII